MWKYSEVVIRGTFSMVDTLGNAEEDQMIFARNSRKTEQDQLQELL
jgi:hypothetical protein